MISPNLFCIYSYFYLLVFLVVILPMFFFWVKMALRVHPQLLTTDPPSLCLLIVDEPPDVD